MIGRGYQPRIRRHRGLGQTQGQVDAFGNPVSCPPGQHFAVGACIQLCNQTDPTAQYACSQSNQQAWDAAAKANGQITDPNTGIAILPGEPVSLLQAAGIYNPVQPSPPPVVPLTTVTTIPTCAAGSYWSTALNGCVVPPLTYAPQQIQAQVVNPSPPTQSAATGTSATSPTSVLSQANGTVSTTGDLLSSVAGYVNSYPSLISGVSNSTLLEIVAVGAGVLLLIAATKGRR